MTIVFMAIVAAMLAERIQLPLAISWHAPSPSSHTHGMMLSTMIGNRDIKRRRTFTLSPESLAFLEREARRRSADSQSAVLDDLLLEKKRERQMAALEANIGAYYDGLGDAEVEEDKIWGEFAGSHLALKEDEPFYDQPAARGNMVHQAADGPSGKRKAPGRHRLGQRKKQSSAR
jgi:hypothetical protein